LQKDTNIFERIEKLRRDMKETGSKNKKEEISVADL
jgi:hypothetical protein